MKKLINLIFLCIPLMSFGQDRSDSWAKVKADGSGSLGIIYYEQLGLIYKGPDGSVKGVCADIVNDFQKFVQDKYNKKLSVEYIRQEPDFSNFLKTFQQPNFLLGVTTASITEDRKKFMKFTPAFMDNEVVMLTNRAAPNIKSLDELASVYKDFTAQVITGSTHARYIEQIKKQYYPSLKIEYVPSGDVIIENMASDPRIFTVTDFTEYIGLMRKKQPLKKQEVTIGEHEELGFVMSKQSDWDGLWREFLSPEYKKSVRFKEIIAQNLGSSFLTLVR